jgi:hypothetical protein
VPLLPFTEATAQEIFKVSRVLLQNLRVHTIRVSRAALFMRDIKDEITTWGNN